MAAAWKSSLSALDRYENIQKLQQSLTPNHGDAIAIEQNAYENSSSREEYESALDETTQPSATAPVPTAVTGVRIGAYQDCTPIAQGVTSEVYRSGDTALKVIVAHRNIEPHNPQREANILRELSEKRPPPATIIQLLETFRDQEQRYVLAFPFLPMTLGDLFSSSEEDPSNSHIRHIFRDVFAGLSSLHDDGIIHRDIKPSAILLQSPSGPAYLSDFGTAWHPRMSSYTEPETEKILDIGTGAYRAPEVLFGNKAYNTSVDMWAAGVMLAEAITMPSKPPFESRPAHEDGSQLGLILSIFKTMGTPDAETWPEAKGFKVSPFELWTVFPSHGWADILPGADSSFRDLVGQLVCFESGSRVSALESLQHPCFMGQKDVKKS